MAHRILAIEDDTSVVQAWRRGLARYGWTIEQACTIDEARRSLENWSSQPYDLVSVDMVLPDGRGEEILSQLALLEPRPAVVVVSGYLDARLELELQRQGTKFCRKPVALSLFRKLLGLAAVSGPNRAQNRVATYCTAKELGRREAEALALLVEDRSRAEVGHRMGCSKNTVDTYVKRILEKTERPRFDSVLCDLIDYLNRTPDRGHGAGE